MFDTELRYREHLTTGDLRAIAEVVGADVPVEAALGDVALERVVFSDEEASLAHFSPFLVFAVAVGRTAAGLEKATFVEERWTASVRIPVFDVVPLRTLLSRPSTRLFLIELLASYTHVSSGARWEKTARGWRRRRFSELDPVRLAELVEAVDPAERPGIYRRLGDLALFLTGVFPDSRRTFDFGAVATSRLLRASRLSPVDAESDRRRLLEQLGPRWYRFAASGVRRHGLASLASLDAVEDVASHFGDCRRILNVVTDTYLFPLRERWFGLN